MLMQNVQPKLKNSVAQTDLERGILADRLVRNLGKNSLTKNDEVWIARWEQCFTKYLASTRRGTPGKSVIKEICRELSK